MERDIWNESKPNTSNSKEDYEQLQHQDKLKKANTDNANKSKLATNESTIVNPVRKLKNG